MKNVTIIGLGLIGGSWARALKRVRADMQICAVDICPDTLQLAMEMKCIDQGTTNLVEGVKNADLVVVATLTAEITSVCEKIKNNLQPGCIITDVGSTKKEISDELYQILPAHTEYIPGHPMAGSESKGLKGADPYLFENAVYILTPRSLIKTPNVSILEELIKAMGGRVLFLTPEEHDIKVAAISHLPHLLASTLVYGVSHMEEAYGEIFKLAAGGFRDLTRIADSQPEMWCDIFRQNRQGVLQALAYFHEAIRQIEKAVEDKDAADILNFLQKAKDERAKVPVKIKGILPNLYEAVVIVPDQPGIIGRLANLLGKENINIIDIEILRVREGDGGTIRLGFSSEVLRDRAIELLRKKGYAVQAKG
ncbi:MAG: prephenate dehydrogenase/arogenate dehydrogenase family protein [Peptococcaceae bacterium]